MMNYNIPRIQAKGGLTQAVHESEQACREDFKKSQGKMFFKKENHFGHP
jgi:hypothetical protein